MAKDSKDKIYMGLNGFVWWFGIVENRADPDFMGRCQVRIFGFHDADTAKMPTKTLPWAHPVTPLGQSTPDVPAEGTMVFGFFADGTDATVPVMLGTMPNIRESVPDEGQGFRDPFTQAQKQNLPFPRTVDSVTLNLDGRPPTIAKDTPKTNPGINLNEPSTSRLARPNRIESPIDASSMGVRSESIANTVIDIQRKNRVKYIKTAKEDTEASGLGIAEGRVQQVWNEPFPSYNSKFPFNHVQETESGHAFEMDDTKDYERVQLSHRTGSTIEFMPSGSIKEKSFNHKYDLVMGNHKEYVAGDKITTTQGGMFLRINGKLVIQADGIDFESSGDINMKAPNIKLTAKGDLDLFGVGSTNLYGAAGVQVRSEGLVSTYGSGGAYYGSGGLTTVSGTFSPMSEVVKKILETLLPKNKMDELNSKQSSSALQSGVKITGINCWLSAAKLESVSALHLLAPPIETTPISTDSPEAAAKYRGPIPILKSVLNTNKKEPTDGMAFLERNALYTVDAPAALNDAIKVSEEFEKGLQQAVEVSNLEPLTVDIPQTVNDPESI